MALNTASNIKKHFGVGYNLLIEQKESFNKNDSLSSHSKSWLDEMIVEKSGILGVEESRDPTLRNYIYKIPLDQQDKIPGLLQNLEDNFGNLNIDIEMI